jgi:hypothetical protein
MMTNQLQRMFASQICMLPLKQHLDLPWHSTIASRPLPWLEAKRCKEEFDSSCYCPKRALKEKTTFSEDEDKEHISTSSVGLKLINKMIKLWVGK